jgi:Protein of unknown function (DUF3035)
MEWFRSTLNRQGNVAVRIPLSAIILGLTVFVAGCSSKGLRELSSNSEGPDEFMVMPVKPLTAPRDYEVLPAPTPGGANLVDQNPKADAIMALGGRASALSAQGVPASDGALVTQSSRYGVPGNIRASLAEEDAAFRKRQARSGRIRLFRVDRYEQAYRKQALDPFAEAERFRSAGFSTPSSPPPGRN